MWLARDIDLDRRFMSVDWDGHHMGEGSERIRRFFGVFIASGAALSSLYIVFTNGSFTTSAWALMLTVPLSLAIGLSGSGSGADVEYVDPLPDYEDGIFSVEGREIEPDDLPIL
tara:strand:- start:2749 stop:3090 length:342 start_codon:yes stop_codon:yes gene_type:complete